MKLALGLNLCTYFPRTVDELSSASNFTVKLFNVTN
ncbi:unnamed protein product [Brassica oleracea var. botrytis]